MSRMRYFVLSVVSILAAAVWAEDSAPAAPTGPTADQVQEQEDTQRYNQDLDEFEKNMNKKDDKAGATKPGTPLTPSATNPTEGGKKIARAELAKKKSKKKAPKKSTKKPKKSKKKTQY